MTRAPLETTGLPQSMQNFEAGSLSCPQKAHRVKSADPLSNRFRLGHCGMGEYTGCDEGEGSITFAPMPRSAPWRPSIRALLGALGLLCALASARSATAQVRPDLEWRTLHTAHFRVHFNPELETLARRTAANAEFAYERLAMELTPPRGIVDIVLADNVDYANGLATPYPTNRIVVYARPPVDAMSLRNHVDWNLILVTHELAHIFHLDRVRGWWKLAQSIFGRAAPLFPNTYAPSWMVEGLAVHYETQIAGNSGGGRLAGSEFPAFVRAAALGGHLPALHELSLSAPRYPGGNVAYIYGAYAMSRMEPGELGAFVEASSGRLIPWYFEASAKKAFGEDFGSYWKRWRDSVEQSAARLDRASAARDERVLTHHGFEARFPRWVDDSTLVYVADDARDMTGAYRLRDDEDDPRRTRLGRRSALDANDPLGGRRTVHGELEWRDPYTLYSDLYVGGAGLFGRRRLTNGERLTSPDLHEASGSIVAVQSVAGTTQLVTLDIDGDGIPVRIAGGSSDESWSEPRWSHDGRRIAAARWERGGRASIVVLDARGQELQSFEPRGRALAIVSSPVWIPGDTALLFVSDHEGRAMIYRGDVRTGEIQRAWSTPTALHTPDVSPDGKRVAAVELGADGYRVITRAMPSGNELQPIDEIAGADSIAAVRERMNDVMLLEPDTAARETKYWAFDHMRPTWWLPTVDKDNAGTYVYGFLMSGRDLVNRHAWDAEAAYQPERHEWTVDLAYSYAGLGNPVLTVYGSQNWLHGPIVDQNGTPFGIIGQREQGGGISALVQRPRVRLSTYAAASAEVHQYVYRTYPAWLLDTLDNEAYRMRTTAETFSVEAGFSTMQRPGLAVSVQDGVSGSIVQRRRLGLGIQFEDVDETVATFVAAKSLPFPGYARHVLAVRGAYGITGHRTTSAFGVGGVSGTSIELIPGVNYGDSRRTFFVRGFEVAQIGVRAAAASAEYRAPLFLAGRGIPLLPFFFQKTTLTLFGDAASAWCEFPVANSFICPSPLPPRETIASVGGELALDAALAYDELYRFRLGVAHPVKGEQLAERKTTIYFTIGSTF